MTCGSQEILSKTPWKGRVNPENPLTPPAADKIMDGPGKGQGRLGLFPGQNDQPRYDVMTKILLLSLAGTLGTLARYWLSGAVYVFLGRDFPWGTWAVNISGCFLFGLVWVLTDERGLIPAQGRVVLLVGFMGAFTTFSTLIFESAELLRDDQWIKMGLNLAGQNIMGFLALFLGAACGRII